MAQTRLRNAEQLQTSTSPRSILITDASSEASYFAPTTGADRLLMWDDSSSEWASATLGTNLSFSGTTLNAASAGYDTIQEEGTPVGVSNTIINFIGGGVTAADAGGGVTSVTLDATLNALAAYNTNGLLAQTAADTFAGRTITGTAARISVTDGNGVAGNPTIDLITTAVTPGSYGSATQVGTFTVDAYGRLTAAANTSISVSSSAISDFTEAVQDVVGAFTSGTGAVTVTYNDGANTLTIDGANIYTDDGTIPNGVTRVVSMGDNVSSIAFLDQATQTLIQAGDGQVTMVDGLVQCTVNDFIISGSGTEVTLGSTFTLEFLSGASTITDSRPGAAQTGAVYAADYSSNYTNRSLVDKEYVDSTVASLALTTTIAYIESSTATTVDLDANTGVVKDRDGNNIAFTLPTDLDALAVYRNGQRLNRTGTATTRDYSLNAGTHEITFSVALTATEVITLVKQELV